MQADEPGWADLKWQARRLVRRARRRPALTCGLALLVTAAAVAMVARRPLRPRVAVVLRLTETQPGLTRMGWTDRALRGYVTEVAFSQGRLRELMERRGLFRSAVAQLGMDGAIALMRERITVEVVQNHVIALMPPADRPHSAHVRVAFDDSDPARGLEVAKELGRLVEQTGQGQRRAELTSALERAQVTAERARANVASLRGEAARLARLAPVDGDAAARLQSARQALRLAELQLQHDELERISARLAVDAEAGRGGLEIELLTPPPPPPEPSRALRCVIAGALALALALPLAALLVGAYDGRVYLSEDLGHAGLECLGRVRREALHGGRRGEAA